MSEKRFSIIHILRCRLLTYFMHVWLAEQPSQPPKKQEWKPIRTDRHNNTVSVWIVTVRSRYQTGTELNFCSVLIWEREEISVSLRKHPWQPPACETRPSLPFFHLSSVPLISADLWVSVMAPSQPANHTNTQSLCQTLSRSLFWFTM